MICLSVACIQDESDRDTLMYLIGAWVRIYVGATVEEVGRRWCFRIYSVKKQLIFQRRGVSFTGFRLVIVAQLVRAPGCGPGGRGFKSRLSPHFYSQKASSQIQTSLLECTRGSSCSPNTVPLMEVSSFNASICVRETHPAKVHAIRNIGKKRIDSSYAAWQGGKEFSDWNYACIWQ